MRNFNENTITDAVLGRITGATDTRIREISEALVRHLHAFVREVRPTQKEWEYGIEFLTRTGHMCDDKRRNSSWTVQTAVPWHAAARAASAAKGLSLSEKRPPPVEPRQGFFRFSRL